MKPTAPVIREVGGRQRFFYRRRRGLPVDTIPDTVSLDEVREIAKGPSDCDPRGDDYFAVLDAGLIDPHDGPFSSSVGEEALENYLVRRESHGQFVRTTRKRRTR